MAEDCFTAGWLRPGDRLVLGCHCGAVTTLAPADLALLLGAGAPLDGIGLRLRCARCGQPPCKARLDWQDEGDGAAHDPQGGTGEDGWGGASPPPRPPRRKTGMFGWLTARLRPKPDCRAASGCTDAALCRSHHRCLVAHEAERRAERARRDAEAAARGSVRQAGGI